jgi:N-acetylmuramic acid 6-phosphate etherase
MKAFVIGVDGGASKTAAVVLDQDGEVLGRGHSDQPSNIHLVGLDGIRSALSAAMAKAAADADVKLSEVAAATWALAGADRPKERRRIEHLATEIMPGTLVRVEHDAVAALVGGLGSRQGIVLIAGTGTIVYGENQAGEKARAGGWGHLLDRGSAYDLSRRALRAVVRASDARDLPTRLTQRVLQYLDLVSVTDIVSWAYAPQRTIADVAQLAPLVLAEAESRDLAATEILASGAEALAEAVDEVATRLKYQNRPFPLVLAGSLLIKSGLYRAVVVQAIQTRVPHARPVDPLADAATGAAWLALETIGSPLAQHAQALASGTWLRMSEEPNVLSRDLDLRTTLELVGLMHVADQRAVMAVRPTLPAIAEVVDNVAARMRSGGRLIYVGAGTSGRLGILDASECPPTFNVDPRQVVGVIAGGPAATTTSVEGAEDEEEAGVAVLAQLDVGPQDSVVGITASGRTPYVMGALSAARRRGALSVALVCNLPAPLTRHADHVIAPLVGPEILAGSTRLKAGTAQKLVLNILSTAVMVRLDKTYGNLMVDVQQSNVKLHNRAQRIVAQACDIGTDEAGAVLENCGGDVKVAIVSTLADCSPETARQRLAEAGGSVRKALEE